MKLKYKFLTVFLTISILPVLLTSIYTYEKYRALITKQISSISNNYFDNFNKDTREILNDINDITEVFQLYTDNSYSIMDDLKRYRTDDGSYSTYDLYQSRKNMKFLCQNLIYQNDYINGIYIFTGSGENIGFGYRNNTDIKIDYTPFESDWYTQTLALNGSLYISPISKKDFIIGAHDSISFSRALYDFKTHELLGVLFIDCSPEIFRQPDFNLFPSYVLLSVISDSGDTLFLNQNDITDDVKNLSLKSIKSGDIQIASQEIPDYHLTTLMAVDYNQLYGEFNSTKNIIILLVCICVLVIFSISFMLSHRLTKPITELSETMRGHGQHSLIKANNYLKKTDEIGILYNEYNHMVEELNHSIKNEYENKLIVLDSQMKALEAQINSHFLFNTLESINSIAEIEEVESISTMALALGQMFRYSIKTQSELVSIEDELCHVQDYISIQQIRFDNRFKIVLDIPPNMLHMKVLKLILQPIVENALYHGLQYCNAGDTITIKAQTKNRNILFFISDNGTGMDHIQLSELQDKLSQEAHFTELGQRNKQSIGLKNIHTRIELYYGKGYGLKVNSIKERGTTVQIKLPNLSNTEENYVYLSNC